MKNSQDIEDHRRTLSRVGLEIFSHHIGFIHKSINCFPSRESKIFKKSCIGNFANKSDFSKLVIEITHNKEFKRLTQRFQRLYVKLKLDVFRYYSVMKV